MTPEPPFATEQADVTVSSMALPEPEESPMDPFTSTVMASAAEAAAALKPVAEQVIKDGYAGLKALITRKYAQVQVDQLEAYPRSKNRRGVVEEELAAAGADQD